MAKFEKGHPGGPGRPPGTVSLVTALKKYLQEHPEELNAVVLKTIADAKDGDVAARKLIFDRVDGAVPQAIDHTTGGQPIKALIGIDPDKDL